MSISPSPEAIYMDYILKLAELLSRGPSTIETIPGTGQEWLESFPDNIHAPFLFIEGNLGVPEKILYKAYMAAVKSLGIPNLYRERIHTSEDRKSAMALTSIILLANPAHQSALNIRKKIIIDACDTAADSSLALAAKQDAASELNYVAALLSLKQCSKISALWHYRRTLLAIDNYDLACGERITPKSPKSDEEFVEKVKLGADAIQKEVDIVSRACEIYPRNYYAWYHRSLCIQSCITTHSRSLLASQDDIPAAGLSDTNKSYSYFSRTNLEEVLAKELTQSRLWIERHISDFSAVDHVCRIAETISSLPPPTSSTEANPSHENKIRNASAATSSVQHALDLLQAYPSHESLWLYLRRTLLLMGRDSGLWHEVDVIVQTILNTASSSCQTGSGIDSLIRESHSTIRHAVRFTIWRGRHTPESDIEYNKTLSACSHFSAALSTKDNTSLMRLVSSIE